METSETGRPTTTVIGSGPSAPVRSNDRVEIIDILRGFAIFGILLVNMEFFFWPAWSAMIPQLDPWDNAADRVTKTLVIFFGQGKFYALFSMLFGVGLAIQMERAQARGAPFGEFFARRMFWLVLIGLAHALLLWFGDILFVYALLGFVCIVFARRKPVTLAVWIMILLAIPLLLFTIFIGILQLVQLSPDGAGEVETLFADNETRMTEFVEEAFVMYRSSRFADIFDIRAREWQAIVTSNLTNLGPQILALFLIGLYLGRQRFFENVSRYVPVLRKLLWWLLATGGAASVLLTVGMYVADFTNPGPLNLLPLFGMLLGAPLMTAFYVTAILLLAQEHRWHRRMAPLAWVGRMALSNYLMHSIVFTTLAYGYGAGLYGRIGPAWGLLMTVAMFAIQIPLSRWWLQRYRFGPAEWLWRSLTYWKIQPMRRRTAGSL